MFNVYKNQLSRQTGSRNLTDPKMFPTIWHTYMKLVTKYQIPVINSCLEKCAYIDVCIVGSVFGPIRFLLPVCRFCWFLYTFNIHLYMHIFLSNYWWQESDIWSQASYRYAILWETFLDPSDCLNVQLLHLISSSVSKVVSVRISPVINITRTSVVNVCFCSFGWYLETEEGLK
jgi:hypothetical protein